MSDLISVIIPIYNVEKYLLRCINSILKQTYTNLEIILVDDGSPDNCGNICDNLKKRDKRIVVIHKKNGGLSSARNAGLNIANGEYVVFIDSDDWIENDYIKKLYEDICLKDADIAVPSFCITFDDGKRKVDSKIKKRSVYSSEQALEIFLFNGYLTPCVASKMWRKSLWDNIRCPEGKLFEDQYTTYKLLMNANKIIYEPKARYYYFKHQGSIGHSAFTNRTYDLLGGIHEEYEEITSCYPQTEKSLKVARSVWELVFINMMILSNCEDKAIIKEIQIRSRKCWMNVIKCEYLPCIRKIEIALFCFSFPLYRYGYKKYKNIKKIA